MILLACQVQLYFPDSQSLKNIRQIVKSLKDRLHNQFNISVAEIDGNELWQRCTLGMAVVSTAMDHAHQVLTKAVILIEQDNRLHLLDYSTDQY